ncbi:hypothetical protein BZL30_9414 [Mycobacterium kansasii]|uniref:Uncharacterized protein n=1 Tax=Mycobacterium kansasii TaxID=1768 RepID=A0A1V3WA46_MYCKA|nr:hypothetical protein BZL30_9414 [Mycobacterium kansasii]
MSDVLNGHHPATSSRSAGCPSRGRPHRERDAGGRAAGLSYAG